MTGEQLLRQIITDLDAETRDLEATVAGLDEDGWHTPTPAVGWDIADQIGHLAYFDDAAVRAITTPEAFRLEVTTAAASDMDADRIASGLRGLSGPELHSWLTTARRGLLETLGRLPAGLRVPWYGPDMSITSFVTARLMETWAHGQDIADAREMRRTPTDRLAHVAQIGYRALPWSYTVRGKAVPDQPVRVDLTLPSGRSWTIGPAEAADVVTGDAQDFCLVVTQRRHLADTALTVRGPIATEWMEIAQAFAGPAGPGRKPGQFQRS